MSLEDFSLSAELKCIGEHIVRIRLAFEGSYAATVWLESLRYQFGVSRVRPEVCTVEFEGQELLSDYPVDSPQPPTQGGPCRLAAMSLRLICGEILKVPSSLSAWSQKRRPWS